MASDLVMELLNGIMAKYSKDNGERAQKMGMAFGSLREEITIKDSGF